MLERSWEPLYINPYGGSGRYNFAVCLWTL